MLTHVPSTGLSSCFPADPRPFNSRRTSDPDSLSRSELRPRVGIVRGGEESEIGVCAAVHGALASLVHAQGAPRQAWHTSSQRPGEAEERARVVYEGLSRPGRTGRSLVGESCLVIVPALALVLGLFSLWREDVSSLAGFFFFFFPCFSQPSPQ